MKSFGKTFVVTGAGNGMGREITLLLLKKGARVAAVDIREEALNETVALVGDATERISIHLVNITDRSAVQKLPDEVIHIHGAVDGLINNAGIIQKFVKINELDFADIERVFNVNFWGMVNMTKTFLPYLLKRPEAHIVNTSSMGGFLPVPGQSAYGASKAAVSLFTDGLHSELLSTSVHVSTVYPGAIATNISANSGITNMPAPAEAQNMKIKTTSPVEAARIIVEGMEQNKYHILVGSDAKTMDFLHRLAPERAAKIIFDQMKSLLA